MKRFLSICLSMVWVGIMMTTPAVYADAGAIAEIISQADKVKVSGKVIDQSGIPVIGAVVVEKDDLTNSTTTNAHGGFVINANANGVLIISFIGYKRAEISVSEVTGKNIVLEEDAQAIEEVQVVAFGTQKKESVLSAITTVRPSELKVPSSNLTTALSGRVAGLITYQRSGEPGNDDVDFFVRGVTSFGYTAKPLILIDGLEVSTTDLARLQPDDIASFSIMKDATATALYGARGANGVVLVTTKEGQEGRVKVSLRYECSVSSPTDKVELADPVTYMKLHNEAVLTRNPFGIPPYTQEKIEKTAAGVHPLKYPATDWYSLLIKNSTVNHRMNMNVSGGGKIARYYIAGTYNIDNGILNVDKRNNFNNNIKLKKYVIRSNVNINITNTTEAVVRLYGTFDDYTGPIDSGADLFTKVMRTNPVLFPAYYPPDEVNRTTDHILFGNSGDGSYLNPYADMVKGYRDYSTSNMIAQMEVSQKLDFITEGLKLRGLFSTTRTGFFSVNRFYKPFYYDLANYDEKTGEYTLNRINPTGGQEHLDYEETDKKVTTNTYLETSLSYSRSFAARHNVSAMLVYYMRNSLVGNAGTFEKSLPFRNMGLSGRFTYDYASRYFIEGNFGYNGSERFAKKNRFGFFPSLGAGWIVSNENFWGEGVKKVIPLLKFKATIGLVGNDAIGDANDRFFYLSQVDMDNSGAAYAFGSDFLYSRNGIRVLRYENQDITWEISRKTNLGVEINLLNVFDINLDVYREYRTNILMDRTYVPSTMGLQETPRANLGEAKGYGIDFSIDAKKNFNPDLWIIGRVNFTYATGRYSVYDEPDYSATPWKSRIGNSLSQVYGYVAERLFVDENEVRNSPYQTGDTMAGDIKFKDINKDGVINELDMVPIGFPQTPEIVYGFGFSFGWKNFDLSCFFQGVGRTSLWIDATGTAPFVDIDENSKVISQNALLKVYADNHWSEQNRDLYALWPRLSDKLNSNNRKISTWFMQDGSFIRLKSLEVGYTLPSRLTSKIGINNLRLYVSGTNLLTFSPFKLWDPEMNGYGLKYPIQKVFNFGVNVSF